MANCNSSRTKLYMRYLNFAHHFLSQTLSKTKYLLLLKRMSLQNVRKSDFLHIAMQKKSKLLVDSGERFVRRFSCSSLPAVLKTRSVIAADEDGNTHSTSDRVEHWQHCTVLFPFVHGNGIPMGIPSLVKRSKIKVTGSQSAKWRSNGRSELQFTISSDGLYSCMMEESSCKHS